MSERKRTAEMLRQRFPGEDFSSLEKYGEGWDNILWQSGGLVYRISRRLETRPRLMREAALLRLLSGRGLPVPVVVAESFTGEKSPGVFVYRPLTGRALSDGDDVAIEIAGFLRSLHEVPILEAIKAGLIAYSPERWRDQYHRLRISVERQIVPLLPPGKRGILAVLETFLAADENFEWMPALVHRDLSPEHILVASGRLSGIIDFGDACVGDPAIDFAGLPPEVQHPVLAQYCENEPVSIRSLKARADFYRLIAPCYTVLRSRALADIGAALARIAL